MKELISHVVLLNRVTSQFDDAEVYRELDQKNLDDFERHWRPEFARMASSFTSSADRSAAHAEDSHWDWVRLATLARQRLGQETFAVECQGVTQGLMLLDFTLFARLPEQMGRELIYVDRLATAPWNRKKFTDNPRYKGVGRVLFATALSASIEEGFEGRLGLHSLPQAITWYQAEIGMADLGLDVIKNMNYYEVTKAQTDAFLA